MAKYGPPVTNKSLLSELEGTQDTNVPQYGPPVSDPSILSQLNSSDSEASQPPKSLYQKYIDFMNPRTVDSQGRPMINTFLGRMPDPTLSGNQMQPPSKDDFQKSAGIATMFLAPEVKFGTMLPSAIRAMLPELSGAAKIGKDYLATVGKTGAGAYLGTKMMPNSTDEQANIAGASGAGIASVVTPLSMLFGSINPVARILAGTGLGSLAGYGTSQMMGGGSPYLTTAGGLAGALLGARGAGASQLAAQNMAEAITPEQNALATQRNAAASQIGVPLTAAEATGSPVLGQMQQNAATSVGGSKVLYPFSLKRQQAEENAYQSFLNKVSPSDAGSLEEAAFKQAKKDTTPVDIKPVINFIDSELPKYESGSKIATALNVAKNRLSITPQTASKQSQLMAPITKIESKLQSEQAALKNQLQKMQSNAPETYFQQSSGWANQLESLKAQLSQNQRTLDQVGKAKQDFMTANNISPYESTIEGLHNAKMGIRGIIEGQGDQAIGRTAAGKLKQVNKILTNQLKDSSDVYANALQISNMRQARQSIEDAMTKSNLSGSNFYDKVLNNRNEYQALYERLGDPKNPDVITPAQKNLAAMRTAFPDLMDNVSAKSGASLASQHPELQTSIQGLAKSFLNKLYLDRYNKAVAELLINPKWQEELRNVSKMNAGEDRGISLGRLISKVAVAGGVAAKQNNLQGSNQYGGQPQ